MATWNEKLSDQLRDLNKVRNPSSKQLARIKELKAIKAAKPAKAANGADGETSGTTNSDVTKGVNDNIADTGKINNPQDLINQAPKTFDPTDPYYQNLYKTTYQNNYDLATQGLDKRQSRDLEEAKSEAANRGLVYDPGNRESAYGKAVGGVTDRYDQMYQTASQQAYNAANDQYTSQGGLANQGHTAFMQSVLGISAADAAAIANGTASEAVKLDYKAKMAAINKPTGSGSSGSSSGSSNSGPIIGGAAPGWGV